MGTARPASGNLFFIMSQTTTFVATSFLLALIRIPFSQPDPPPPETVAPSLSLIPAEFYIDKVNGGGWNGAASTVIPGFSSMVFAFNYCKLPNAHQEVRDPEGVEVDTRPMVQDLLLLWGVKPRHQKNEVSNAIRAEAQTGREYSCR